jgi:6-phosphogluconolactonase (cycloisomerase 2 family)
MRTKSVWALVFAAVSLLVFSSCSTSKNASTASGIVWVATAGDQMISTYSINSTSGAGSRVGNGVPSGVQPSAMVMTPDRSLLFVANVDDNCGASTFCNQVREFSVNTDGTLKAVGNPVAMPTPAASSPQGMRMGLAVDPTGQFLFVTNQGNSGPLGQLNTVPGSISILPISSSGLPSTFNTVPSTIQGDATGNGPVAIAVAPAGNFVYVANQFTNSLALFSYDATAATIAVPAIASYATGANPAALAFSRCAGGKALNAGCTASDGDSLFVANSGLSNNISIFAACIEVTPTCANPDGRLQVVTGSPVSSSAIGPSSIIVSPQLDFVYTVDTQSNEVSQFRYGPATGLLTSLSPATISTGSNPVSGGITSDGAFVIVPDSGGSDLAVFKVANTVSSTGAAPTGLLSRASAPSVTLASQPSAIIVR